MPLLVEMFRKLGAVSTSDYDTFGRSEECCRHSGRSHAVLHTRCETSYFKPATTLIDLGNNPSAQPRESVDSSDLRVRRNVVF